VYVGQQMDVFIEARVEPLAKTPTPAKTDAPQ
jgi:hypothetical protein